MHDLAFYGFLVGAENEEDMAPVSVCTLLSNVNLVFGLIITAYSATMWACIDPILEPELRTKVKYCQKIHVHVSKDKLVPSVRAECYCKTLVSKRHGGDVIHSI